MVLSGELELGVSDLDDAEQIRQLVAERLPTDTTAARRELWHQIDAALSHEGLRLPAPPGAVLRAQALLEQPETSVEQIAAALETDPSLATKLVGVANSPFFRGLGEVSGVRDAITPWSSSTSPWAACCAARGICRR